MAAVDPVVGDPVVGGYRREPATRVAQAAIPSRTVGAGAAPVGAVIALLGLWAAMVPYAGPAFGYSADGSAAWHWNLAHALLGLVPGAIALVAGLLVIAAGSPARLAARRTRSALLAAVAAVCGAWLAIGVFAWPVLYGRGYLRPATPLHALEHVAGSGLGSGLLLALFGGMGVVLAAHGGAVVPLGPAARRSISRSATVPMRLVATGHDATGRDEEPAPLLAPPPPAPSPARVSTAPRAESGGMPTAPTAVTPPAEDGLAP